MKCLVFSTLFGPIFVNNMRAQQPVLSVLARGRTEPPCAGSPRDGTAGGPLGELTVDGVSAQADGQTAGQRSAALVVVLHSLRLDSMDANEGRGFTDGVQW